jgi:Cys-tRNA synthase (O-phospho-L-seryl-tRNA:Cys-tRNA synthase)
MIIKILKTEQKKQANIENLQRRIDVSDHARKLLEKWHDMAAMARYKSEENPRYLNVEASL